MHYLQTLGEVADGQEHVGDAHISVLLLLLCRFDFTLFSVTLVLHLLL